MVESDFNLKKTSNMKPREYVTSIGFMLDAFQEIRVDIISYCLYKTVIFLLIFISAVLFTNLLILR